MSESIPKDLRGRVAVVAGASRGAGRGIALALGEAKATVYVLGRTSRDGPKPEDGAPGTIEETAEAVTARGGTGIPLRADCTRDAEVAAAFERVEREQGKLHVLANAVWGFADAIRSMDEWRQSMRRPFWEEAPRHWKPMMGGGPRAYCLASCHAARLMAKGGGGLIVGLTDGIVEGVDRDAYQGPLIWDLAHVTINRLMLGLAAEGKRYDIAVVTLMPGFMQTERVRMRLTTEKLKKQFRYDLSESPEYVGRAVVALAKDPRVSSKSGKICFVADLAKEYGFTDVDGRAIPRFNPLD